MARKKVKLELITSEAARRATFKKRRKGLIKKVSELSTLCDVKACLIVYSPNEPGPEVWPSVPDAVRVLAKLKRMPEMEQSKKMMNQEGFMRARITKLQDQLRKQDRENRELETMLLMFQSLTGMRRMESVGIEDVTGLAWMIEMKVNEVKKMITERYNTNNNGCSSNNNNKEGGAPMTMAESQGVVKEAAKMKMKMKMEQEDEEMVNANKEKSAIEIAMDELQRQEWFTDIMNPQHEHMVNLGGEGDHHQHLHIGGFPFGDPNINIGNNNAWLDAFFPLK